MIDRSITETAIFGDNIICLEAGQMRPGFGHQGTHFIVISLISGKEITHWFNNELDRDRRMESLKERSKDWQDRKYKYLQRGSE